LVFETRFAGIVLVLFGRVLVFEPAGRTLDPLEFCVCGRVLVLAGRVLVLPVFLVRRLSGIVLVFERSDCGTVLVLLIDEGSTFVFGILVSFGIVLVFLTRLPGIVLVLEISSAGIVLVLRRLAGIVFVLTFGTVLVFPVFGGLPDELLLEALLEVLFEAGLALLFNTLRREV